VDLLEGARSGHLALLAAIAEEVEADPGVVLIHRGEPTDAFYVVIEGTVELEGVSDRPFRAEAGAAFGTWALIDEAPSLVGATVAEPSRLLRIARRDFYDLLADHAEMSRDLLKGLARRVRSLATTVGATGGGSGDAGGREADGLRTGRGP
jgi:CRP-like cAMP-binding protein